MLSGIPEHMDQARVGGVDTQAYEAQRNSSDRAMPSYRYRAQRFRCENLWTTSQSMSKVLSSKFCVVLTSSSVQVNIIGVEHTH